MEVVEEVALDGMERHHVDDVGAGFGFEDGGGVGVPRAEGVEEEM